MFTWYSTQWVWVLDVIYAFNWCPFPARMIHFHINFRFILTKEIDPKIYFCSSLGKIANNSCIISVRVCQGQFKCIILNNKHLTPIWVTSSCLFHDVSSKSDVFLIFINFFLKSIKGHLLTLQAANYNSLWLKGK